MDPRLASYPLRSGFIVPWQAEILAAWRWAYSPEGDQCIADGLGPFWFFDEDHGIEFQIRPLP